MSILAKATLIAWFLRDAAFAAAWSHYRYFGSRGEFDGYALPTNSEFEDKP